MKRLLSLLAAAVMVLPFVCSTKAKAVNFPLEEPIQSESAVLINLDSNMVIHEKNADVKQMPGPLVNIMTAVVCLENCEDLDEKVTIDESIYEYLYNYEYPDDLRFAEIEDGDVLTMTDLLYAMMLTSSVEACETIAYKIGKGDTERFVEMMNEKAAELGLFDTHFTNPTGLYDPNQYTTANDMTKLTMYALDVPMFETIATTYSYTPSNPNPEHHDDPNSWIWTHSNVMMDSDGDYAYSGTKGIKTANLDMAGRNIITMASRDGNKYLAVLLKSPLKSSSGDIAYFHIVDAMSLFDWAFGHFSYKTILADTAEVGELPVELAEGNDYVLAKPKEEFTRIWYDDIDISTISRDKVEWYKTSLQAPVAKGEPLGKVTLEYSGEELGTVEIVAVSNVERSVSKYNIYVAKMFRKSRWFNRALMISFLLCAIYILVCIYAYVVFKSKSKPMKPIYAVPKVNKNDRRRRRSQNDDEK
ncbi:D-alanyl-D-alanine carboxypeptidase family protein [Ruminococcus flavefaciens]|uniref:D-alanyl-D-alanine carboxypeptidase family protein n=1 Tax=Ruminococcus flavefaciens TaxID=1265 RepID=UPI00048CA97C|nr:D-alanyl-D-alanine carboxypeptidase family protein [Ruminococcus flavefaciens]